MKNLLTIIHRYTSMSLVSRIFIGLAIGVVQDSLETALNNSGDVFFTAIAEQHNRKKKLD